MDDDADFCNLVQVYSKQFNIEWIVTHNEFQAIHRIQEHVFDLALLDYKILDGSCEQVIKAVNLYKPEMPVVVLSGFLSPLVIDSLSEIRKAIYFVRKPDLLNNAFFTNLFLPFKVGKILQEQETKTTS